MSSSPLYSYKNLEFNLLSKNMNNCFIFSTQYNKMEHAP